MVFGAQPDSQSLALQSVDDLRNEHQMLFAVGVGIGIKIGCFFAKSVVTRQDPTTVFEASAYLFYEMVYRT